MSSSDRVLLVIIVAVAIIMITPIAAMVLMMPTMGGMWGPEPIPPAWIILSWLALLVVLVAAGYLLYRTIGPVAPGSDRAIEELRVAYARGDLEDEEYEKRYERLRDE